MGLYAHVLGVKQPPVAFDPACNLMGPCKSSRTGQILGRIRFLILKNERNYRLDFIEDYNRTMAKPFKWTYQGKPLMA